MARPTRNIVARFLEKVAEKPSGCHEWTSSVTKDGYGKFGVIEGGKLRHKRAHRVAWELFVGAIPDGKWILHRCDNRKCVNVQHLYAGTPKDNVADKIARCQSQWGRMKTPFAVVEEARRLYDTGQHTQQAIADLLGLKQSQVSRYVRRTQRIRN